MADNYLITGYWGEPHVTAENDRGINAAMFGTGRFVLPVGEQFKAEYIGNNTIRMYDGKLMNNGAAAGIPVGEYVDMLIANAGQGMKRNDLIVFQYSQDASTLIESGVFTVIQGAESSGTASDPSLTQGDLLSGKASFDQMALWRVSVSGATISAPVKLFSTKESIAVNAKAISDHMEDKNNPHGVTIDQIGAEPAKSMVSTRLSAAGWYRVGHVGMYTCARLMITSIFANGGDVSAIVDIATPYSNPVLIKTAVAYTNTNVVDQIRLVQDDTKYYVDIHYNVDATNDVRVLMDGYNKWFANYTEWVANATGTAAVTLAL